MPLYTITTSTPISSTQQQTLVSRITKVHCTFYATPSSFVNVLFVPTPSSHSYYASNKLIPGGKTLIQGLLRPGESRTFEGYNQVIGAIADAYIEIIGGESKDVLAYVTADVNAVRENGVFMPKAGEEAQWYKENREKFAKLAETSEEFRILVDEFEKRRDLKGLVEAL